MAACRKVSTFVSKQMLNLRRNLLYNSATLHAQGSRDVIKSTKENPLPILSEKDSADASPNESLPGIVIPTLDKPVDKTLRDETSSDPLKYEDYFGVKNIVSLKDLFEARVHLGHKTSLRHIEMKQYIYGHRYDTDIIDLNKTLEHLQAAMNFAAHIAYREGVILFISRNKQYMPVVESTAKEVGEYSHCRYWRGGLFTNSRSFFGFEIRLPDLCIFINTRNNVFQQHKAVTECAKMLIPAIGIVDTNCDPRLITYPVPGNDDTPTAAKLYCAAFKEAIKRGKARREKDQADVKNNP